MYGEWVEGLELIVWMRQYNVDHRNILHYYGTDIGGFYQDWKTPFDAVLEYLCKVDNAFGDGLALELSPFLKVMSQNARINHQEKLSPLERATLKGILDQALHSVDERRDQYIAQNNNDVVEYEWARQSLESMRLAEHYYDNYLQQCQPETSKFAGLSGREIAMHRNTLWAMKQRRLQGVTLRVIVIHHVVHTKMQTQYQEEPWGFFTPAGEMLRQSLGNQYFVIGMAYGGGEYWQAWQKGRSARKRNPIPAAHDDGLEATLEQVGQKSFFLPWDHATPQAQPWLNSLCSVRENDYFLTIRPLEWNACIFIDEAYPATPVVE